MLLTALLPLAGASSWNEQSTHARPEAQGATDLAAVRAALAEQRWELADKLARAYLAGHPDSVEARYVLAQALFHENQPRESLAEYTRAANLRPPSALDFRYIALNYVLLKDYSDADRWIERSAKEDNSAGETWYAMGRIKYTENRFAEAVASFDKALLLMPRSVKAEDNLGLALEGLNEQEKAIQAYRLAIKWQLGAARRSEQPLLNLGVLLTNRNQLDEARSLLTEAVALAPRNGKVHAALGKLYQRMSLLKDAQSEFEQAIAAQPDDAALHFQLGQVLRKEGIEVRAKEELARAAALDNTHSSKEPD